MSFRSVLTNRDFRTLWIGQLISRIGDGIHEIALIWVVYEVTGDAALLSIIFIASFLPTAIFGLFGGAVADRYNRKYLLVFSDIARGLIVLVIPLFGRHEALVPLVIGVAFVTGTIDAFDGPARGAMIPRLVPDEQLDSANSLRQLTSNLAQTMFVAGGAAVALFGSFNAFYIDAVSFLLSGLIVATIPAEKGVVERDEADVDRSSEQDRSAVVRAGRWLQSMGNDVREVLFYTYRNRVLLNLVVFSIGLQFALAPVNVALPVYAPKLPISGGFAVGLLYSAFFTGMSIGSLANNRYQDKIRPVRGKVMVGGLPIFGLFLLLAVSRVASTSLHVAGILLALALAGFVFSVLTIAMTTLRHLLVPDERMGRFNAVVGMFGTLAFTAGLGISGPLIELFSAQFMLVVVSALAIILGVVFLTQPLYRVEDDVETITKESESQVTS